MTDPNAKPKYAIYDGAVGALTFLEGNSGVQFSGQLNGGNYIEFPDDWIGKTPPQAVRTIDFNTINVQLTPLPALFLTSTLLPHSNAPTNNSW